VPEGEGRAETSPNQIDLQLGYDLLTYTFGGSQIYAIEGLNAHQMSLAAKRYLEVHSSFHRPKVEPEALAAETDIIEGCMVGVATADIASQLGTTERDVKNRTYKISQIFIKHTTDEDRTQLFREIRHLPRKSHQVIEEIGIVATQDIEPDEEPAEPEAIVGMTADQVPSWHEAEDDSSATTEEPAEQTADAIAEEPDTTELLGDDDQTAPEEQPTQEPEYEHPAPEELPTKEAEISARSVSQAGKVAVSASRQRGSGYKASTDGFSSVGSRLSGSHSGGHRRREGSSDEDMDLVHAYLVDIGKHPLLTKDDEQRLAQEREAGLEAEATLANAKHLLPDQRRQLQRTARLGRTAELTFVQSNLRLVVSIAKKYQGSGLPLLDIVQEGNLGLMHAVEKFEWRKGFKFSTYATWWIRQSITRGIANSSRAIRLPVHAGDTLNRAIKARTRLELELGRRPTQAEIAADLEMSEDKLKEVLQYGQTVLSLSEPLREDGDAELGDIIPDSTAISPAKAAVDAILPEEIKKLLKPLDNRERKILALRFGLDGSGERTLEEVGREFNVTRERIRQIEARAMSKLRHPSTHGSAQDLLED